MYSVPDDLPFLEFSQKINDGCFTSIPLTWKPLPLVSPGCCPEGGGMVVPVMEEVVVDEVMVVDFLEKGEGAG